MVAENNIVAEEGIEDVMQKFRISRELGFLTDNGKTVLPENFAEWKEIADNIPALLEKNELRKAIEQLDVVDCTTLKTYEQLRLGHLYAITLVSAYLWGYGKENVPMVLPKSLSGPMLEISKNVGMPPVVCHGSTCVSNWKKIDPEKEMVAENLELIAFNPLQTRGNAWFFVVTAEIEQQFGEVVYQILNVIQQNQRSTVGQIHLDAAFDAIQRATENSIKLFKKMSVHLSAEEFYHRLRPFLWGYNEGILKEKGLIFEGFEHMGPLRHGGASAAQSTTITLLDAFLKVNHKGTDNEFLQDQLNFIPLEHKEFILWVRKHSPITTDTPNREMATKALREFRTSHLSVVAHFILSQVSLDQTTGTGGTPFMKFLKDVRNDSV